jgi:hypothetical protein
MFPEAVGKLEAAWQAEGREGEPCRLALSYFSLDDDPEAQARETLGGYYAFLGDFAEMLIGWAAKGRDAVKECVEGPPAGRLRRADHDPVLHRSVAGGQAGGGRPVSDPLPSTPSATMFPGCHPAIS